MIEMSRRNFVLSASAAAVVLGADGPVAFLSPANAQKAADAVAKGFHAFKVGAMDVITVFDGMWEKDHDPGFIKNATLEETKAALKAGGLSDAHVTIPFTVTFVKTGGKTIMFDSGTGGQLSPKAGKLAENMKAAGIDKVDTVIVTHYHPDHIFGLMAKDTNAPTYPNAEIVVPAAEHAWWTDASVFTKLPEARHGLAKRIQATLATWKNVSQVSGEREVASGIRAIASPGHTPGHTIYVAGSGKDVLMVLADTSNIPALFVKNPGWHVAFDADPVMAETNRRRWFDKAVAEKAIVTGYHYGMPGAGTFQKDGAGYAFVPLV